VVPLFSGELAAAILIAGYIFLPFQLRPMQFTAVIISPHITNSREENSNYG
jgi:hypothetical protein